MHNTSRNETSLSPETARAPFLYQRLLVAIDSSDHSNRAATEAVALAGLSNGEIIGSHVYAAKMHDVRFRQMEGGLPEQFQQERELERQRDVHDSLITRGLSIITDSYLDQTERTCASREIPFRRRSLEGKNYRALAEEANGGQYDLLVMGALGLGAIEGSRLGTVCQRVVRRAVIDTLVIKDPQRDLSQGPIVVAVDGSPRSYGGLVTAIDLASERNQPVHVIAAYDPYYHYVAFNRIAGVLSEEAGKVFRFKEQEKLHEEVIDSGLAKIYQGHLEVAGTVAHERGVELQTELLDGKPHDAIAKYVQKVDASLLVIGKLGIHADPELDIGGNAENLLNEVGCAVLLSQRTYEPPVDVLADVTTSWTNEALVRMQKVPSFVQSMARMAILRYAQERGHTVITERIVEEATARLCPSMAEDAMRDIVDAYDRGEIGKQAGESDENAPQPGLEPSWSGEAEARLGSIANASVRDNLKRRAEKRARVAGADSVELEHLVPFLENTGGGCPFGHTKKTESESDPAESLYWTATALARLQRIPEGFMRELTRQRIELFARHQGADEVTPSLMDEKYAEWGEGSARQVQEMVWSSNALERLARIPDFVRGMVIKEIERCAREMGHETVDDAVMEKASGAWADMGSFHSEGNPDQYT